MGISAKWMMAAEARDFRESLAVDQAVFSNSIIRELWLHQQLEAADTMGQEEEVESYSPNKKLMEATRTFYPLCYF